VRYYRQDVVERIKGSLAKAIEKGDTLEQWRNDKLSVIVGAEGIGNAQAQTIYRTGFQSARQAAMRQEFNQPDLRGWIVAYEYRTAGDDRVREEHEAMEGVILEAGSPELAKWWPPNGFNCRCTLIPIDRIEARNPSMQPTSSLPDAEPDPGFDGPPEEL
jgi:SPP1 gp7 family putative phage head morphogenesis protein